MCNEIRLQCLRRIDALTGQLKNFDTRELRGRIDLARIATKMGYYDLAEKDLAIADAILAELSAQQPEEQGVIA